MALRTRMLKASCEGCGYTVRLTRKWARVALPTCPDPCCQAYGSALHSPEWEPIAEAEFEQLHEEIEAWEADALATDYRPIREKDVRIRKPRQCDACRWECQIGETMTLRVYTMEGALTSTYSCTACELDKGRSRKTQGDSSVILAYQARR